MTTFFLRLVCSILALALASFAFADSKEAWRAYLAKEYVRAIELAKQPAESGDKDAQYLMGLANKQGRGIARNDEAAVLWFTLAAERGHADALNDLATCFSRGEGVAKDETKAFEYFRMAAERGSPAGEQNTARLYETGVGTPKDPIKARFWYERADASIYGAQLRRSQGAQQQRSSPIKSLPESCRPAAPPTAAMNRAKIDFVKGSIDAFVDGSGRVRGVRAINLTAEELRYEVVAVFSTALRAEKCFIGEQMKELHVQIPFTFKLQ
jgi:TPR repeat protein